VFHPPGYALVAAIGHGLGGVPGILVVQILLGTFTVWVTFLLGRAVAGPTAGLIAAGLVAIEPLSLLYTGVVLTEITFTALLVPALLLLLLGWRRIADGGGTAVSAAPGLGLLAGAGLLLGLDALVRPVVLYLPVLLVVLTVAALRRTPLRLVAGCLALLVAFAVPVGLWAARNVSVAGGPTLTSVDSYNLLAYRAAAAVAADEGTDETTARKRILADLEPQLRTQPDEYSRAALERRTALRLLREHKVAALKTSAKGSAHVLAAPGTGTFEDTFPTLPGATSKAWAAYTLLLTFVLLLGAVVGLVRGFRSARAGVVLMAATAVYLLVVTSGAEGESRFRLPVVPLLAVLTAVAVVRIRAARAERADRAVADRAEATEPR
jgi:hypothetical protein